MAASEILQKPRAAVSICAGLALTANLQSAAQATALNNTLGAGNNGNGASMLHAQLKVTTAPSSAATCTLFLHGSQDGVNFATLGRAVGVFLGISTGNNNYYDLLVPECPPYAKFSLLASSYNMTVNLDIVPLVLEGQ